MNRNVIRLAIVMAQILFALPSAVWAAHLATWDPATSLVDTTNYNTLGPYYWFANFANPSAVTGSSADNHEVRLLPSWIHYETRSAFIGKDDSGTTSDNTSRTGFSLVENATGTVGDTSIGGQAGFNSLTLPNGATGTSGEITDSLSVTGNTSSFLEFRILPGAPDAFRIWVVTDNGAGLNFQDQARLRVSIRSTTGAPLYAGDLDVAEAEALPGGVRIGQTPTGHDGTADAWSFLLSGVTTDDVVIIRPTSAAASLPAIAGFIITPVPEPSSIAMLALGLLGCTGFRSGRDDSRR
jgi:hypothetical protein